jgi:hypothetical protein
VIGAACAINFSGRYCIAVKKALSWLRQNRINLAGESQRQIVHASAPIDSALWPAPATRRKGYWLWKFSPPPQTPQGRDSDVRLATSFGDSSRSLVKVELLVNISPPWRLNHHGVDTPHEQHEHWSDYTPNSGLFTPRLAGPSTLNNLFDDVR